MKVEDSLFRQPHQELERLHLIDSFERVGLAFHSDHVPATLYVSYMMERIRRMQHELDTEWSIQNLTRMFQHVQFLAETEAFDKDKDKGRKFVARRVRPCAY